MKRRTFITSLAAAAGVGSIGTAAGQQSFGQRRLEGIRIHRFERDGTAADHVDDVDELEGVDGNTPVYAHTERFVQRRGELEAAMGESAVTLQESAVPGSVVEELSERARASERRGVEVSQNRAGGLEVRYEDTAVVGTFEQFVQEEKQRQAEMDATVDGLTVDFPLHVYKGDDPSEPFDLGERTGPINVGWDVGMDASSVASETNTYPHWSIYLAGTRYVIDGTTVKPQDENMGWNQLPLSTANQYHARVYDVDSGSAPVVAQAHLDPVDHGHLVDPDWEFADSQDFVTDRSPWGEDYSVDYEFVDNDDIYGDSTCYGLFELVE